MAEENKGPNLNLAGMGTGAPPPQREPDQNSTTTTDNSTQTAEGAPNTTAPAEVSETSEENLTQTQRGDFTDTAPTLDEASAIAAADSGVTGADEGEDIYTSHPVGRFKVGRFVFDNGVLRLTDPKDKEEFATILASLAPRDRLAVRKLSLDRVDEIVRQRSAATRQFDSSVGREAIDALRGSVPTIGVEDVSHAARPQMDNNVPEQPTDPVDPEGRTGLDQGPHTEPAA